MEVPVSEITGYIAEAAGKFGVDPKTATAMFYAENMGKAGSMPATISTSIRNKQSGAIGIMQVMPGTLAALKQQKFLPPDHDINDWRGQVDAGLAAISETQKRTGISDPNFLAAGYEGSPAVAKAFREGRFADMPESSRNYQMRFKKGLAMAEPQASQRDVRVAETGVAAPATPSTPLSGEAAFLASTENNGIIIKGLMDDMLMARDKQGEALARSSDAITREAVARGEATAATGAIEVANNLYRRKLVQTMDLNPEDVDGMIATTIRDRKGLQFQRKGLADDIDARMSVGFFDNPIEWFVNQTILPGMVSKHNALARRENEMVNMMTTAQHQTQAQENIDVAANADALAVRTNALVRADSLAAQAKVAENEGKTQALRASTALGIAHLVEGQDRRALTSFSVLSTLADKAEKGEARAEQKAEVDSFNTRATLLSDAIGRTGGMTVQQLKMLGKPSQEAWAKRVEAGNTGSDLGESLQFINRYGNLSVMTQTGKAETADLVRKSSKLVSDNAKLMISGWGLEPKNAGQKVPTMEEALNRSAKELQSKWDAARLTNMKLADPSNPYIIDHSTLATNFKGDANNLIYQMVRQAVVDGVKPNDDIILGAVQDAVRKGQIDPRVAARNVTDYYGYAIARNNVARDFRLIGLEKQENYILVPAGSEIPRDLTNATVVENMLVQQKASSLLGPARFLSPGMLALDYFGPKAARGAGQVAKGVGEFVNKEFGGSNNPMNLIPRSNSSDQGASESEHTTLNPN